MTAYQGQDPNERRVKKIWSTYTPKCENEIPYILTVGVPELFILCELTNPLKPPIFRSALDPVPEKQMNRSEIVSILKKHVCRYRDKPDACPDRK